MLDENVLRRLYIDEQRSIRDIAGLTQQSPRTVYDQLIFYRIQRRPAGFRRKAPLAAARTLDEPTLRSLYITEARSIRAIAAITKVSPRAVYDALIDNHIPRRHIGRQALQGSAPAAEQIIDEARLRMLYEAQGYSIAAIATLLECSASHVRNALVRLNIPRRRRGRATNKALADQASEQRP